MTYLLDTNIVSELAKDESNPSVITWLGLHQRDETFLSAITVGELQQGIVRLPASRRKAQLSAWLHESIMVTYAGSILPIDTAIMLQWGSLTAQRSSTGRTMPVMDAIIAATALEHGLTLVTRNVADFSNTGLDLVNPWDQ